MDRKLSRRNFFKLAGGGIAAAIVAPKVLLDKIIDIPVEYGWTWYVDATKIPSDVHSNFSQVIIETLRKNAHLMADNVSMNNPLLVKLKNGQKAQLRITMIDPDEQTKRMSDRLSERIYNKYKNYKPFNEPSVEAEKATFYEGYENLEKKYLET